tara:strand:+ start:65 stop:259 length:195 start_codon:yes stop_codon:yes gene_type:complete
MKLKFVKHKWREIDMTVERAKQELNRLIDFYRDMVSKSNYKSASHTIKQAEKALDFLCSKKEEK